MILLSMVLLMAVIALIAISSMRMAMLQSRASDAFANHVQALQAADIAIKYCEGLVSMRIISAPPKTGSTKSATGANAANSSSAPAETWTDLRRWNAGAAGYFEIPFDEHGLAVAPKCLIDELPTQFVVTARGFSPNYVRGTKTSSAASPASKGAGTSTTAHPAHVVEEFDGAEVWLQSVTVKPDAGLNANGATTLNHSWRQIVTFPS